MTENQENRPGSDVNRTNFDSSRRVRLTKIAGKSNASQRTKTIIGWEETPPREGKIYRIFTDRGSAFSTSTVIKVAPGYIQTKNSVYRLEVIEERPY